MKWRIRYSAQNIWDEYLRLERRPSCAVVVVGELQQPAEEPIKVVSKLNVRRRANYSHKMRPIKRRSIRVESTQCAAIAFFAGVANRSDSASPDRVPPVVEHSTVRRPMIAEKERHDLLSGWNGGLFAIRAGPHPRNDIEPFSRMPRTNIVGNGEFVAGGEQFVFSLIARCTSFDGVTSIKSRITPRSIRSDLRLIHFVYFVHS